MYFYEVCALTPKSQYLCRYTIFFKLELLKLFNGFEKENVFKYSKKIIF